MVRSPPEEDEPEPPPWVELPEPPQAARDRTIAEANTVDNTFFIFINFPPMFLQIAGITKYHYFNENKCIRKWTNVAYL